ncbi:prolyl hydroxylase family protein [Erythrobacter dokdonensis]|jgi:prolyl 4-hydroxylase|uniref:Prolyl 4-hydroxylase, alpha subunit n=1 Tax=Erythrobacter dokdonensis DSW-74 TaxID=1300349 RepID=A0A1A7BG85_9SPHN|nr:2OG-Fe(II) oxygenase [Erythrobacter dokdonensis]MEE4316912.1 2OG-Fe(II) oxygenase [Erythrobacter sp.]OBV11553.1 Prolyl 4-hydroxylase, alpha subunit [Erythrobacter dokdonensis DSW-74]
MTAAETVPDQQALALIGEKVRKRLAADPGVYPIENSHCELFAIGNFLSPVECTKLCAMIDEVARPSSLHELDYASGFRTSYSGDLDPHESFVKGISRRIDDLLGLDSAIGEAVQGQRYLPGQQFQPHNDWFYTSEKYWQLEKARGGQRSWTAMAYLNEVEAGGGTHFTRIGIEIEPKPGVLLIWNNALPDGRPNEGTMHAGMPVLKGAKYVITKWYRTRQWR